MLAAAGTAAGGAAVARRRRAFASDTTAAAAYAGDVEGWLQLTGYAGDAAATARALRCRAVDSLTESEETLAAAQVLVAIKPPDLARLGKLREVQGRLEDAAETFEAADMAADALRNWRAAGSGAGCGGGDVPDGVGIELS